MKKYADHLLWASLGWTAFFAVDAAAAVPVGGGPSVAATALAYLAPWALAFAVPTAALGLIWARASAATAWSVAALSLVGAPLATLHFATVLWAGTTFKNRELSALLVTGITCIAVVAAIPAYSIAAQAHARWPRRMSAAAVVCGTLALAVLVWVNVSGLGQLSPWVFVAPVVGAAFAGAAIVLVLRSPRVSRVFRWVHPALLSLAIVAAVMIELRTPEVPGLVAGEAPWSRYLAAGVHLATDFDSDGYSSVFGGTDCAPWDPDINPGVFDLPGDGIDNNCLGGDAVADARSARPKWDEGSPSVPNLVVLTVDALRPDHTIVGGYHRNTTPNLAELAKKSVYLQTFYTASTFTRLALSSLFSTRAPSEVDFVEQPGSRYPRISESTPWLPSILRDSGFRTAAFVSDFSAFAEVENIGFDRGFQVYDTSAPVHYKGGTMRGFPGARQVDAFGEFLRGGSGRFFAWIHFVEPHYKYQKYPGSPDFGEDAVSLYDSEIWGVDQEIGRVLEFLRASGHADDTMILVTGDHGEEFMEHGRRFHGSNLYEPQARTFGLLHVPGVPGRVVRRASGFPEIGSTLLNLLGVRERWSDLRGTNLAPLLRGESVGDTPVLIETWKVRTQSDYRAAVVVWPYKLLYTESGRAVELYDLVSDPQERQNLALSQVEVTDRLQKLLFTYIDSTQREYAELE